MLLSGLNELGDRSTKERNNKDQSKQNKNHRRGLGLGSGKTWALGLWCGISKMVNTKIISPSSPLPPPPPFSLSHYPKNSNSDSISFPFSNPNSACLYPHQTPPYSFYSPTQFYFPVIISLRLSLSSLCFASRGLLPFFFRNVCAFVHCGDFRCPNSVRFIRYWIGLLLEFSLIM